jgi:hypothetical protein
MILQRQTECVAVWLCLCGAGAPARERGQSHAVRSHLFRACVFRVHQR